MKKCFIKFFNDPEYFGATILRLGFGLLFLFAGIAKLRMGYTGFTDALLESGGNMANEIPAILLTVYGYILPALELLTAVILLVGLKGFTKYGFAFAGVIYVTLIFGQAYDGNLQIIGNEYFPSMLALFFAAHLHKKMSK